jgi:hypothetical protein
MGAAPHSSARAWLPSLGAVAPQLRRRAARVLPRRHHPRRRPRAPPPVGHPPPPAAAAEPGRSRAATDGERSFFHRRLLEPPTPSLARRPLLRGPCRRPSLVRRPQVVATRSRPRRSAALPFPSCQPGPPLSASPAPSLAARMPPHWSWAPPSLSPASQTTATGSARPCVCVARFASLRARAGVLSLVSITSTSST